MTRKNGTWIRKDKRLAIYLRDRFACLYCEKDLHDAKPKNITLDHIKPVSKGGKNKPSNLVTACRKCNCSRQNKSLGEFANLDAIYRIRRNVRRSLWHYLKLARTLMREEKDERKKRKGN